MICRESVKKFYFSLLIIGTSFMIGGCGSNDKNNHSEAYAFCLEKNGTVIKSESGEMECHYPVTFDYDDGNEVYTAVCEINTLYHNPVACSNLDEEGIDTAPPLLLPPYDGAAPIKLREAFGLMSICRYIQAITYTN